MNLQITSGTSEDDYPKSRYGHRMVYHPDNQSIILFGGDHGYLSSVLLDSVWNFDLDTNVWANLSIAKGPCARFNHGLIYDSTTNKIILFGGREVENYAQLSDTWLLDLELEEWVQVSTSTQPPPRSDMGFYYDLEIQAAIMFGGYSSSDTRLDDTWLFFPNNNSWLEVSTAIQPLARYGHHIVYDEHNEVGLLFGGRTTTYTDETWQFNSTTLEWSEIITSTKPIKRYWHAMTFSSSDQKTYIFGGRNDNYIDDSINQTAVYDPISQDWDELVLTNHHSERAMPAMVYHEHNDKIVLFGGLLNYLADPTSDLWVFDISTQEWSEIDYHTTNPTSHNLVNFIIIGFLTLSYFLVRSRKKQT